MTAFEVWVPRAAGVEVVLRPGSPEEARVTMRAAGRGWWQEEVPEARHGTDYGFVLSAPDEDGEVLKDPRSRWQPAGVHGPSRVYDDTAFAWTDHAWRGVPLPGAVLYELHIGTFTAAGTFDAAIERLDHLVDLGVDAVEVMPVNGFNGDAGWGYDGVDLYSVHEPYGGPDGFKRFVDACHGRGLGVVLDVVYNHLGPSGNVLGRFGPYLTDKHQTPWGDAVNLDDEDCGEVRRFVIDNALRWLRDFHVDGLRLDAVHALKDDSATHLLEELATNVDALATQLGKPLFLVAESDLNDPRLVRPRAAHGHGLSGMWADDLHHSVHSALTGERGGYYVDFGRLSDVVTSWTAGYRYAGDYSGYRKRRVGRPLPPEASGSAIVVALQNHDQIGNRATGDRLSASLSEGLLRVGAALVLLSPMTPLLFMGEEWAARTPWRYFTSHPEPELAEAVRTGRRSEFAAFGWDPAEVPDPQDPQTLAASVLDWSERDSSDGQRHLSWYRDLLALRRNRPALGDDRLDQARGRCDEEARWIVLARGAGDETVVVVANLADRRQEIPIGAPVAEVLLASAPGFLFGPGGIEIDAASVLVARLVKR